MIGIDEVGRGCWAGPMLVVAARQTYELPAGLKDSKLLSKKNREKFASLLSESCIFGEGWVTAREIDKIGLSEALKLASSRALENLNALHDEEIILDGNINYCPVLYKNVNVVVRADSLYPIVSAASIYAKVRRDAYMAHMSKKYTAYGFEEHVGYGTKKHLEALKQMGPCLLHRYSYKPVRECIL